MSYTYYGVEPYTGNIIQHYGIHGQKKGKRRWQYPDGRFNEAGKERYFGTKSYNELKNEINTNYSNFINAYNNNRQNYKSVLDVKYTTASKEEKDAFDKMYNSMKQIKVNDNNINYVNKMPKGKAYIVNLDGVVDSARIPNIEYDLRNPIKDKNIQKYIEDKYKDNMFADFIFDGGINYDSTLRFR